jgi:tetratricopeptide (TPR) repeat protein
MNREKKPCVKKEAKSGARRSSLGNAEASVAALKRSLACKPDYAPALMSVGSVEYQLGRRAKGRKLFLMLLSLPKNTPDIITVIDEAGEFLIQMRNYRDGLDLYRAAAARFPKTAVLHQGIGCCAAHERFFDEAIAASQRAFNLEAGRLEEAQKLLENAIAMDPANELARTNLSLCKTKMLQAKRKE